MLYCFCGDFLLFDWVGGTGEGKAMMCGDVVAVLIGHGEAPDLLAWSG